MLRLKYLRMKNRLSQQKLEETLKINHTIYSSIETGRMHDPYDWIMEKLINYFSTTKENLLSPVSLEEEKEVEGIRKEINTKSGKQGGATTSLLYGRKHMAEIGRKGSEVVIGKLQDRRNKGRRGDKATRTA